jgi:hypothetical protein
MNFEKRDHLYEMRKKLAQLLYEFEGCRKNALLFEEKDIRWRDRFIYEYEDMIEMLEDTF